MKFFQVTRIEGYESHINPDHIEYYEPWMDNNTAIYLTSGKQITIDETIDVFKARLSDFDAYAVTLALDEIDAEGEKEKVGV